MFKSIAFYFKCGLQQCAQFPLRKSFAIEPLEVTYREITQQTTFVFPKRHLHTYQLYKKLRIGPHESKVDKNGQKKTPALQRFSSWSE